MLVIYYRFRETIIFFFLFSFFSCNFLKDEIVRSDRNMWFELNVKSLDQLYIVPNKELSDTVSSWISEKIRFLNHYEPFCALAMEDSDSVYCVDFIKKKLEKKVFQLELHGDTVIVYFSNSDLFCAEKSAFINQFRLICHEVFVNQRKNSLLQSGYLKEEFIELNKFHPWSIKIPDDFKIIRHKENFLWIRTETISQNSHILIHKEPYVSNKQFQLNSLVQLRDSLAKNNVLYKKYDSLVYMETEFYFPITIGDNFFEGFYSKKTNGAWSINKDIKKGYALGGPYIGYALVDNTFPLDFYYLEAFFSAPNVNKLPYIRTLEAILRTFELNNNHE
jgi:hypothetical protein